MKAVWFNSFGLAKDVLVYGEQEVIQAGNGEVLVRLKSSAANNMTAILSMRLALANFDSKTADIFMCPQLLNFKLRGACFST